MNSLESVKVKETYIIGTSKVVFVIDLTVYPHLRNATVLASNMADIMRKYPRATAWSPTVHGNELRITVIGTLNQV